MKVALKEFRISGVNTGTAFANTMMDLLPDMVAAGKLMGDTDAERTFLDTAAQQLDTGTAEMAATFRAAGQSAHAVKVYRGAVAKAYQARLRELMRAK